MRVGWLGPGAMGAPMAACLVAAGHSVSAYDLVPDRAPQGASAAVSVPEAVTGADAIVVMAATPEQLDQVLSSAAPCLAPGQAVAIMSTVGPEAVVAAAARLEAADVAVVDLLGLPGEREDRVWVMAAEYAAGSLKMAPMSACQVTTRISTLGA